MNKRFTLKLIAACAISVSATAGFAQDTIKIANIVERYGGGATASTNFKNGVELAVKKIKGVDQPGVLMDVSFDSKGDLDRESFMIEVKNGKQEVVARLPPLGAVAVAAKK